MNIFKLFNKNIRTINGYPVTDNFYDNRFPWANKKIKNTNLTIAHIIMLWWLEEVYKPKKSIPNYFEKNYIKSFEKEIEYLIKHNWIDDRWKLSNKARQTLQENYGLVESHRNGWITLSEKEKFKRLQRKDMVKHNKNLKKMGLNDIAIRNKKQMEENDKHEKLCSIYKKGRQLSVEGKIDESNAVLEPLLKTDFKKYEILYERLAINYRKQKRYDDEIKIIDLFLNSYSKLYDHEFDKLKNRRLKAIELNNK